jgi:hypothetical protein
MTLFAKCSWVSTLLGCLALVPLPLMAQDGSFRDFEVTVLDESGKPLKQAVVNVIAGELDFPLSVDDEGFATLNLPNDAEFLQLTANCPGHIPLEVSWYDVLPKEFTFKMSKGQPIGGIVRDERGKPIANVKVEALPVSGQVALDGEVTAQVGGELGTTDSQGRWQANVATAEPIELRLKLSHDKFFSDVGFGKRRIGDKELRSLEHVEVMEDLVPPQGTVCDAAGQTVEHAKFCVVKLDQKLVIDNGNLEDDKSFTVGETSADGKFEFAVPKAEYAALFIADQGWALIPGKQFAKNKPVDVKLAAWARVEGTLLEHDKPKADELLQVLVLDRKFSADSSYVFWRNRCRTNEKGEFVFERLANGYATIGARIEFCTRTEHKDQDVANEAQLQLHAGETVKTVINRDGLTVTGMVVPLRYDESEASIECGAIKLEKQDDAADIVRNIFFEWGRSATVGLQFDPVKNAEVMLAEPPKPYWLALVEFDGGFNFASVPPGSYQASVTLWGHETDEEPAGWLHGYIWENFKIAPNEKEPDKPIDLGLLEIEVYEGDE